MQTRKWNNYLEEQKMRPNLTKNLSIEEFQQYYWLKEELQKFCREHSISPSGSKIEIANRIEVFLRSGEILQPVRRTKQVKADAVLSLDTVINEEHRCSQQVRAFFQHTIGPKFHFSTFIQDYFKNNVGKIYRDAVDAWKGEEERKKDPTYKREIAPQFEYHRFTQDFFADPNNKEKTRQDAIDAWNAIKQLPGSNKYQK